MRALHYEPSKVVQVINVSCALHNICLHYGVSTEDLVLEENLSTTEESNDMVSISSYHDEAVEIRRRIAHSFQ